MISYIHLRNWKAFDSLTLDLGPGTTFVVSKNGVGKTSLFQGALWALFGSYYLEPRPQEFVRGVNEESMCRVRVSMGGEHLDITRRLWRESGKQLVEVNGEEGPAAERLIAERVGQWMAADVGTLASLAIVREGAIYAEVEEGAVNLLDRLSEVLGHGRARRLADEAAKLSGRRQREADRVRRTSPMPSEERRRIAERRRDLTERLDQLETSRNSVRSRTEKARALLRLAEEWESYDEARERRSALLENLTRAAAQEIGVEIEQTEDLLARLETEHEETRRLLRNIGVKVADLRAEKKFLTEGQQLLSTAQAVCPTCLRPLSDSEARDAARQHTLRAQALEQEEREQNREMQMLEARVERIEQLLQRGSDGKPHPPVQPRPEVTSAAQQEVIEGLEAENEALLLELGAVRQELNDSQSRLGEDDAAIAQEQQARAGYREAALLRILSEALLGVTKRQANEIVEPITTSASHHWKELWGGSTTLRFAEDGAPFLEGKTLVPYPSFSGGEKSFSGVLLRLTALQALCKHPILWLDEPLEHLDPPSRRMLASLFVHLTAEGHFEQVLLTTYEEHVARRLAKRDLQLEDPQVRIQYITADLD